MRKIYVILPVLILTMALILPLALPVGAASPNVIGYLSGSCTGPPHGQPDLTFGGNVKLLSDMTIVGSWHIHYYKAFEEPAWMPPDFLADSQWRCDVFSPYTDLPSPPNPPPSLIFYSPTTAMFWGMFKYMGDNKRYMGTLFENGIPGGFIITDNGEPGAGYDTFRILSWSPASNWPSPVPPVTEPPFTVAHGNFQISYTGP